MSGGKVSSIHVSQNCSPTAVGSLVVRASDSRPEGLGSMPDATKYPQSTHGEDFGKRNMSGKRTRRHFSQLSEFERGLIIGMKTAGWSTRHVAGQVDRSECAARNCWKQLTREVTCSTIRADVGIAIVPQTISRHLAEANLKPKRPFRALPLTPEHRQLRLQWCQARSMWNVTDWQKVVFSDESRLVLGTDDNRVRV
ncbi:transposable element Tc1 transposase [Trichonephila clavipes]|nr:transposable element Tc1 transposase [Trichonephila clavipes]